MILNTKSNSWIHGDWNNTQCSKRQYVFSPSWPLSILTLSVKEELEHPIYTKWGEEQVKGCWSFLWFLGTIDDGHSIWGIDSEIFSLALISGRLGQKWVGVELGYREWKWEGANVMILPWEDRLIDVQEKLRFRGWEVGLFFCTCYAQ